MTTVISREIDQDTRQQPDVDMVITCRGNLVFAWSSADEVIHVYDCETHQQRPRVVNEMEIWGRDQLEAFADQYVDELGVHTDEPEWRTH